MANRELERYLELTQLLSHLHTQIDHLLTKLDVHHTPTPTHTTRPRERLCSSIVHSPITTPSIIHTTLGTQTFEPITHPFTPLPPDMTADHKPTRPRLHSTPLPTDIHPGKFNARPSTTLAHTYVPTRASTTHTTTLATTIIKSSHLNTLSDSPLPLTGSLRTTACSLAQLYDDESSTSMDLSFPFDPGGPG